MFSFGEDASIGQAACFPVLQDSTNLYFAMVEKVTVHSENRLTIHLFDGTEVGCDIE